MLEFSDDLAGLVDAKKELKECSTEEIEIRANTLEIINYIYEKLDKTYSRMNINDFIWLLGQNKSKMTKPYHRTLTSHY
jgi:transcriptional regulator